MRRLIGQALEAARDAGELVLCEPVTPLVEVPRESGHGDLASNVAMVLARTEKKAPRRIAEILVSHLRAPELETVEIAGQGFINVTLSEDAWRQRLVEIIDSGDEYGRPNIGMGENVQVEFVSANPTGPLHIGHGRGAATGDALARVLEAAGFRVQREYYVNDAGRQMEVLGRSVRARYLERCGVTEPFPEDGYPGEYVREVAQALEEAEGRRWVQADEPEAVEYIADFAARMLLERIRKDLEAFGVTIDSFTSERQLHADGTVDAAVEALREAGHLYERDGAVWFRSTDFGDDKDRALVKRDGDHTYFAGDIAYHRRKFASGLSRVIDVWGADHHGYVKRVRSALEALGQDPSAFKVVLVQMVNLTRDGEPVRMGKRSGEFIALRDVLDEVGPDIARFFFLMRKSDAQLEFDLELARRQTAENPVFYIQYAHTRIAGIFRQAAERGIDLAAAGGVVSALRHEDELALIRLLDEYPDVVEGAARSLEPHRIVFYAQKLAGEFHRFYSRHRCVSDDVEVTAARLVLVGAVKQVIGTALRLVGVHAPSRM
ncbi:MAG: arginine--tRNA ligase [Candidatus Binatia bacterium]